MSKDLETALEAEIVAQALSRLAERLRSLANGATADASSAVPFTGSRPRTRRVPVEAYLSLARRIYSVRRQRAEIWPAELFGEPGWDILLDLYINSCEGRDISVTSACIASCVPSTTALRWMKVLESSGLIERHDAPHDFRVQYVRLTVEGARRMQRFLRHIEGGDEGETQPFLLRVK